MDWRRVTLGDFEALAEERIDPDWFGYFAGGAGDERGLRRNLDAFARHVLVPRVLAGVERVDTRATILGHDLAAPVVVAPVAYQVKAHPDAEPAMARAAASCGLAMCLSSFSSTTPAEVVAGAPGVILWHQVYVFRDRGLTDDLIDEALDAGCSAVVVTVDLAAIGARDRERRVAWKLPEDDVPAILRARRAGTDDEWHYVVDPSLDWAYIERLVARVPVPVVVKGVLAPEDAVLAAEHGVAGVVVSNHGGRQLDLAPASIDVLPEIVEAAGDRVEVLLDSGIRRGDDVAVALALGARAVLAGRVPIWGLGAGGEDGARTALDLLCRELATALHLLGCTDAGSIGPDRVRRTEAGTIALP